MTVTPLKEADLYEPIAAELRARGYEVMGEVKDCDVAARRGDELVVVELKRSFTLGLLIQAVKRQSFADAVYLGLPMPGRGRWGKRWREMCMLVKRLGLGLLTVDFRPLAKGLPIVTNVEFEPPGAPVGRKKDSPSAKPDAQRIAVAAIRAAGMPAASGKTGGKPRGRAGVRRRAVLGEMDGRTGDHNRGGRSGADGSLVTAYREQAVHLACLLERHGPLSPAELRRRGAAERAALILQRNVYGWFRRPRRGVYDLAEAGRDYLANGDAVVKSYRKRARVKPKS